MLKKTIKKKRLWYYVQNPSCYSIVCDKCQGTNIEWSEYDKLIWCYDCKIDTKGTAGIFDSPIPVGACELLGISFDRYYIKTKKIQKF